MGCPSEGPAGAIAAFDGRDMRQAFGSAGFRSRAVLALPSAPFPVRSKHQPPGEAEDEVSGVGGDRKRKRLLPANVEKPEGEDKTAFSNADTVDGDWKRRQDQDAGNDQGQLAERDVDMESAGVTVMNQDSQKMERQ